MERATPLHPSVTMLAVGLMISFSGGSSAQESLLSWDGEFRADNLGSSIAALPDVTGDGIPDVLVGEFWGDCNGTDTGAGYVYSGKDGTTFAVACGVGDQFGYCGTVIGDVDSDGVPDYAIGGRAYWSSLGDKAGR